MNKTIERIPAAIIFSALIINVCAAADSNEPAESEVKLLTDAQASIEAASVSAGDYRLQTGRQVQLDLIKVREWYFHFGVKESILYDYEPSQLDHQLYYFKIGYDTPDGRVSFFWDHTCNNPTRILPADKISEIHWNEFGIGYETHGMRLGHKNDGISFDEASQWLNKLNWSTSFSLVWMRNENDYDYMLKLGLRDDVFRISNHVFYSQFKVNAIYDDRGINYITSVEAGDRINLAPNLNLVPFVSYEHYHDWYNQIEGEEFYLAGLRLEAPLGPDNSGISSKNQSGRDESRPTANVVSTSQRQPLRLHVAGGYNQNMHGSKEKSNSSDVYLDLDLLKFGDDKILTLNTFAGMLTEPGKFEIQNANYKIGPSLNITLDDYHLRLFHSYSCLYGAEYESVIRKYNLIGAEFGRNAQLSWDLQGAVFPTTSNFDYHSLVQATMGYDFNTDKTYTPYLNGSLNYLLGDDPVFGNALEGGLKFPGEAGDFIVYLRHEDSYDVFRFGRGEQTWLGFRIVL